MGTTALTLAGLIREHASERPGAPAIVYDGRTISYRDLHERSNRIGQALAAAGVGAGDRVAILDKNGPEFFEVLLGAAKVGAVTVAVNWRLAPPEIAYVVNDAEARVLVTGAEHAATVDGVSADLTTVRQRVVIGDGPGDVTYDAWLTAMPDRDPGYESTADDVAIQMYTSGTTGLPRGAMLTNENLFTAFGFLAQEWGFDEQSVNLVVMPLYHIAGSGWALCGMVLGGPMILHREVVPAAILDAIPEHRVTHALFVPAVLQLLLATPGVDAADFSSLHTIVYGASPIAREVLVKAVSTFGCDFSQAYGLTETTGAVVLLPPPDHDPSGPRADRLRAAGKAMPGVELRIVDAATGADLPVGEVGEVWIRSRQVMRGYWHLPEATAAAITDDGWFRSGDAGYLDPDGYLFIHDRVKDMIISGAENIYPAEVENVLMSHPAVADVAVIGVPDERWGETVKAVAVRAAGVSATDAEIIAFCRERLAHYKCPTSIDWTDVLPRNPTGKLLKRELREPYWRGHERRVH